jgi:hypothetical protein
VHAHRLSANCATCNARPEIVHSPIAKPGMYCGGCCPECARVPLEHLALEGGTAFGSSMRRSVGISPSLGIIALSSAC